MSELRALLAARERLYAEAEHVIDTTRFDVDAAVDKLARELAPTHERASMSPTAWIILTAVGVGPLGAVGVGQVALSSRRA